MNRFFSKSYRSRFSCIFIKYQIIAVRICDKFVRLADVSAVRFEYKISWSIYSLKSAYTHIPQCTQVSPVTGRNVFFLANDEPVFWGKKPLSNQNKSTPQSQGRGHTCWSTSRFNIATFKPEIKLRVLIYVWSMVRHGKLILSKRIMSSVNKMYKKSHIQQHDI